MRFLVLFIVLYNVSTYGQEDDNLILNRNDHATLNSDFTGSWIFNISQNDIDGSYFLFPGWGTTGIVVTLRNQRMRVKDINYNIRDDVFVTKISKDTLYLFNSQELNYVEINNRKFKSFGSSGNSGIYEVLGEAKDIQILKKYELSIRKANRDVYTLEEPLDKYVIKDEYYIYKDNNISELKLSRRSFSQYFGDQSEAIEKYIVEHKIKLKDERDLQLLLNYYETL